MSEMIKRVAAAIADPGKYCGFRGDRGMTEWQARAAIEALRPATREMRRAGGLAFNPDEDVTVVTAFEAGQAWSAMIDAALAEKDPG